MACLVFALIGLALGLTVPRDGKLGGFVVGIGVIFAYYIVMFLAESLAKGHRDPGRDPRALGARNRPWPFGIIALIWRARLTADGCRSPSLGLPHACDHPGWRAARQRSPNRSASTGAGGRGPLRRGVVWSSGSRACDVPDAGLLDRYISRLYLRVVGLSFLALLGCSTSRRSSTAPTRCSRARRRPR